MENIERIGEIVKFHRKQSGLSQLQLAQLSAVGKTVIFDIEKGKPSVRLDTLLKVLKMLNIRTSVESPLMKIYMESANEKG